MAPIIIRLSGVDVQVATMSISVKKESDDCMVMLKNNEQGQTNNDVWKTDLLHQAFVICSVCSRIKNFRKKKNFPEGNFHKERMTRNSVWFPVLVVSILCQL